MTVTLSRADYLSRIKSRSALVHDAAGAADLRARVPGCPGWSLHDLVEHVGSVQRFWAAVVAADQVDAPPPEAVAAAEDRPASGELRPWAVESTELLAAALHGTDPDRACWAWWSVSAGSATVESVARHQVQEAAIHAFDAQEAAGCPEPVPMDVAVDGIADFVAVSHGSAGPWPHRPARIALHAAEGPRWLLDLGPNGPAFVEPDADSEDQRPAAVVRGGASDLLLVLHRRIDLDRVLVEGDLAVVADLLAWPSLD